MELCEAALSVRVLLKIKLVIGAIEEQMEDVFHIILVR